jgi:hypothetical protein
LGSEDVAQCDFKIEVATSLAKIELFIYFQDSENSYLQVRTDMLGNIHK